MDFVFAIWLGSTNAGQSQAKLPQFLQGIP